ncbi:pentapeptide repeat-containing protein [Micromonospora humidisoli]|uniref:Pentapeptide repeat-containing protein n=1 Tax=Micromonospora humidisoli TaxID=2807622 RepID=A0ABS2JF28_9ACTN|nr:pentapeptide repeat-containing protein [Micromonospora humidisoli]MBM7085112.1 pentapeptide repeat-containing protein [Micromonospora humidisoli]
MTVGQAEPAFQEAVRAVTQETGAGRLAALRGLGELVAGHPGLRSRAVAALADGLRASTDADGWDADARREAGRVLAVLLRPAAQTPAGSVDPGVDPEPPSAVDLDLRAATVVDLDLAGAVLGAARFADARFLGATSFADARFTGVADFARTLWHGPARFTRARFLDHAAFGRARFRADADFTDTRFAAFAWFGRGEDEWWEDDPAWETVEETSPAPWDEPNEADPHWPVAVLMGDYQEWSEGGDGARFVGPVSFRQARFAGPTWFFKARFAAAATFRQARFAGPVHLDQPTVDLTAATWAGAADDGPVCWPLGWTPALAPAGPDGAQLVPDDSVRPYAGQLADADPDVRRAGLAALADLGDARPELRQRVVDAVCGYLRMPLSFDLAGPRTDGQAAELELRRTAQRILAARLRPSTDTPGGPPHWAGTDLMLCGATLVDLDLGGCHVGHADFTGVQFHGGTGFAGSVFTTATFTLGGGVGRASFHGPVSFAGARLDRRRSVREVLGEVAGRAGMVPDEAVSPPG